MLRSANKHSNSLCGNHDFCYYNPKLPTILKFGNIGQRYSNKNSRHPKHHRAYLDLETENLNLVPFFLSKNAKNLVRIPIWTLLKNFDAKKGFQLINTFCNCKQGNKTVGACAHVLSLLVKIGIERGDIEPPQFAPRAKEYTRCILSVDKWVTFLIVNK